MVRYLAELFAFLIILAVLYRYVVPPLRTAMRRRQESIRAQFDEARKAKEEAEAAEARYQQMIDDAHGEADEIRRSAEHQAELIREELRARAEEVAERVAERGRQQAVAERDTLVRQLRADMGALAVELASRIVTESLADDDERRKRTVERVLEELDRLAPSDSSDESRSPEVAGVADAGR